ncbi:MAG TPA: cytochrome c3 family protein [Anaeromyxobacteraceae bacterium]|nr:cytochrome c3 family protein [Anaeromyxobacteraceae bacterium]
MKKILSALFAVAFVTAATAAFAAPPPTEVVLNAKEGNVTFNHKAHQSQGCKNCHGEGKPGKIELNKDKAHKLCIDCHKEKAKGPADEKACTNCHKK